MSESLDDRYTTVDESRADAKLLLAAAIAGYWHHFRFRGRTYVRTFHSLLRETLPDERSNSIERSFSRS